MIPSKMLLGTVLSPADAAAAIGDAAADATGFLSFRDVFRFALFGETKRR